MARQIIQQANFKGGLSFSEKEGLKSSYLFSRAVDHRSDPSKLTILPKTAKVSGTVVADLILDADQQGTDLYLYGDAGHLYKRDTSEVWTDLRTVSNSSGNGMKYFGEDSYLYYTSDIAIGRYGPFGGTKSFSDDFLGAESGVPLNTHSLDLELSSSQYATAADSASLSITGDITLEGYFKLESLPAVGDSEVFISKWNRSGNQRSYLFELYGVSGYFGDGDSGALTISSDTTQAPVDSGATGTAAAYTLSATNASFAVGDKILIHQSRGTNAGRWERNEIASYTAGTITLANALQNTYTAGAQVIVLEEYTNVTINASKTWTAKAWDGTVGGILAFLANGTLTINGAISANGKGFRGGDNDVGDYGYQGEGTTGAGSATNSANGNGGGGGGATDQGRTGVGGGVIGSADLTTMVFGGGGGGGEADASYSGGQTYGKGGIGGGIVFGLATTITMGAAGAITTNGATGGNAYNVNPGVGAGGGGAGGSILLKAQVATLGTTLILASAGSGGTAGGRGFSGAGGGNATVGQNGGYGASSSGGVGRIHLDYYTSYTGTTTPTLDVTQDNSLVTNTSYQLRFGVSSTGTNEEFLTKTLSTNPQTAQWYRFAVNWDASASLATFSQDSVSLGTSTGTLTAIYNSTALLAIGAKFDAAGAAEMFLDGKVDDVRVWNDIRTASELSAYMVTELAGTEANLQAYWKLNNAATDATANANNLTLVGSPSYDATDVAFSSKTSRRDLDQSLDTSGQVYSLTTAINEGATHRQTFVPAKDPQKSIEVNISDKGDDGDWTLTVHDGLNRVIASKTVVNADLNTGDFEFTFASTWRPIIGASYHFHLTATSTTGAPAVVTTTVSDIETADFHTYYQYLVDDANHPIEQILNLLAIGNERYLATWDGITYSPHKLTLPSGYRIRCLGTWREYLAIGTTRGTNLSDFDQGRIFFWDGNATTYNFYIDVPEGAINCILSGDPLFFMAGYSGDFLGYSGGKAKKIRRMPKVTPGITLEFNRKAMAMWRALVHIGMCDNSTSTALERGVYSWGSLHAELPETLSFDYPLSLGVTTPADLDIGLLYPMGTKLFISWKKGIAYGVDSVSPSNAPFATATCEFLISDLGKIWAEKQAQFIRGYFKKLVSGDSVTLKYKIDRNDSWTAGTAVTTADKKEARLELPTKGNRYNEFQVAVDLATSNTTSPEFYGWGWESDDLQHERRT